MAVKFALKGSRVLVAPLLLMALLVGSWAQAGGRSLAITLDDVPGSAVMHDACDPEAVRTFNRRLLATLAREDVKVTGFVVGGNLCTDLGQNLLPELLSTWSDAGHMLGNHSYSHPDFNRMAIADYLADIDRGAQAMGKWLPSVESGQRFFRAPMLHTGDTQAKRNALAAHLQARGYRDAIVTIDNQEWVFAAAYVRAKRETDTAKMDRIVAGYVQHLRDSFAFFEAESKAVFGREPAQILLLHANELNADHFSAVMAMIRSRGYRMVSLDQAVRDPAFARNDAYVGPRGLSWILRHSLKQGRKPREEPREPAWLRE